MGRFTRPLAAVVFGGALIIAAGPAVFADGANAGRDGASDQRAVAVGTDAGSFDINSGVQAPDHPTTISVGGGSNLGVAAPDLNRVPSNGDGQFGGRFASLLNPPAEPEPAADAAAGTDTATATEETAPAAEVPAETADGEPIDAVPLDAVPEDAAETTDAASEAPALPTCGDYGSWYDAQVALESDAGLSPTLDPDGNGIACETGMY